MRGWMFSGLLTPKLYYRVCCFVLFYLAASASFQGFYNDCHFHESGVSGAWGEIGFERMVDGSAPQPFVYRRMLPNAGNWIDKVTPQALKTRLYEFQASDPDAFISSISYSPTAR